MSIFRKKRTPDNPDVAAAKYYGGLKHKESIRERDEVALEDSAASLELMAALSTHCAEDRSKGLITTYVDVKEALIEKFGEEIFNLNKAGVQQFLQENVFKVDDDSVADNSEQGNGIEADIPEDFDQEDFDQGEWEFITKIKDLCMDSVSKGKELSYLQIKRKLEDIFGPGQVAPRKEMIRSAMTQYWKPALPQRGSVDVDSPPPTPKRTTMSDPDAYSGGSAEDGGSDGTAAQREGVANDDAGVAVDSANGSNVIDGIIDYNTAPQTFKNHSAAGYCAVTPLVGSDVGDGEGDSAADIPVFEPTTDADVSEPTYASPEVAPSLNENMMRGSVRSSTFHMKLNASEALYTENAISAVSEEGNYTAPATLDSDGVGEASGYAPSANPTYAEAQYVDMGDLQDAINVETDQEILEILEEQARLEKMGSGKGHLGIEIIEYDKDEEGKRVRFLIKVDYSGKSWQLWKYYSDFENFRDKMLKSKRLMEYAAGLPEKHSIRAHVMKGLASSFSVSRSAQMAREAQFQGERMARLEEWLRRICKAETVATLYNENSADEFLELFHNVQK